MNDKAYCPDLNQVTRRIKMIVQFDGAPFQGWQSQPGCKTVQDALEEALAKMMGQPVRVVAAGRTDTGVHAMAMPVHFDTDHPIPTEKIPLAMSSFLPDSISILVASDVPPSFDARRSAILRWYRYQISLSRLRRPLGARAWHVYRHLDFERIEQGLATVRGKHDFEGFRSSQWRVCHTQARSQS